MRNPARTSISAVLHRTANGEVGTEGFAARILVPLLAERVVAVSSVANGRLIRKATLAAVTSGTKVEETDCRGQGKSRRVSVA